MNFYNCMHWPGADGRTSRSVLPRHIPRRPAPRPARCPLRRSVVSHGSPAAWGPLRSGLPSMRHASALRNGTRLVPQVAPDSGRCGAPIAALQALRACLRCRRGSRWSAIGMSGCFGCAAWAGAHASSRGVQSPDFAPTLRAAVLRAVCCVAALANSGAIDRTPRLASHPAKTAARPLGDRKQALTRTAAPACIARPGLPVPCVGR